jgi:hypothetical protein
MNDALLKPCAEWAVLLAASPAELTAAQQRALAGHLATCRACQRARADYALQDAFLQQQPAPAPLEGLPTKLVAAWAAEDGCPVPPAPVPGTAAPARRLAIQGEGAAPARRLAVQGVMVLVVALLVGALVASHLPATNHPTGQGTQTPGTATPTATPGPDGTWVTPQGLANLKGVPTLAPSNPNILYQVFSMDSQTAPPTISRSNDSGATWQTLPVPFVASGQVFGVTLGVSPLDAQVVVLQVAYYASANMPTTCPDTSAAAGLKAARAGFALCYLHYLSRDGGRHWQLLALPVSAQDMVNTILEPMGNLTPSGGLLLRAQGARLYAFMEAPGGSHLLVSADGGQTWRVDDAGIGAASRYVCAAQVLPAPDGSVIFALVSPLPCGTGGVQELWRSDDAGATWHRTGPLPGNAAVGVQSFVVSAQGARAMPLIYAMISGGLLKPSDLKVSVDGGATWLAAPDQGIVSGIYTFTGPLAVLGDGSVLAGVQRPLNSSPYLATALYRWKPGEAAWHQVAPAVTGTPYSVLVTGQPETVWMVSSDQQGGFMVQRLQPNS